MPQKGSYPGGLAIVNPLREYGLEPIYGKLLEPRMDLEDVEPEERAAYLMAGQQILAQLRKRPANLTAFRERFWDQNQLEWANVNRECAKNACEDCRVEEKSGLREFRVVVDKQFMEFPELKKEAIIGFNPPDKANATDFKMKYTVASMSTPSKSIWVSTNNPSNKPLVPGNHYRACIVPDGMVFNSRCRTLDLLEVYGAQVEQFVFPKAREALARKLPSLADFERHESRFISGTQFSTGRPYNAKQREAIHAIVSGLHGTCPYILFGPPGTGKTVTLVEAVRLLVLAKKGGNGPAAEGEEGSKTILVCTPSNTAADNFALALLETGAFKDDSILRIFSVSKKVADQNPALLRYRRALCIPYVGGFGVPPKEELLAKDVLICTLNTSTYLVNGGLQGCFSHVIVDEASQADELETLIPIIGLGTPDEWPRLILAGDPQQLGPVQTCELLKGMAIGSSLIERLIGTEQGRRNAFEFDKRITIMLEENYRSHPALVSVPSGLFYGGKLRPSAPIAERSSLAQWQGLPTKGFPLLWHSVEQGQGIDEHGHSYCNEAECDLVCQYVFALTGTARVRPEDIGIITPYRYQVRRLRAQLGRHYSTEMLVDSVERFQGSERRVIIISTVRTSGHGFLDSGKRFNTAVTRPKELLIIIGHSGNMRRINGWSDLIIYCEQNGALIDQSNIIGGQCPPTTGPSSSRRQEMNMNEVDTQLAHLAIEERPRRFGNKEDWDRANDCPTPPPPRLGAGLLLNHGRMVGGVECLGTIGKEGLRKTIRGYNLVYSDSEEEEEADVEAHVENDVEENVENVRRRVENGQEVEDVRGHVKNVKNGQRMMENVKRDVRNGHGRWGGHVENDVKNAEDMERHVKNEQNVVNVKNGHGSVERGRRSTRKSEKPEEKDVEDVNDEEEEEDEFGLPRPMPAVSQKRGKKCQTKITRNVDEENVDVEDEFGLPWAIPAVTKKREEKCQPKMPSRKITVEEEEEDEFGLPVPMPVPSGSRGTKKGAKKCNLPNKEVAVEEEDEQAEEDEFHGLPPPRNGGKRPAHSKQQPKTVQANVQQQMIPPPTPPPAPPPAISQCPSNYQALREMARQKGLKFERRQGSDDIRLSLASSRQAMVLKPNLEQGERLKAVTVLLYKNGQVEREADLMFRDHWMLLPAIEGVCDSFFRQPNGGGQPNDGDELDEQTMRARVFTKHGVFEY